jgi:hypothetical protein
MSMRWRSKPADEVAAVARFHLDQALRKALLELAQHRRQQHLTDRGRRADAQAAAAPLAQMLDAIADRGHFPQDNLGVFQKMLARLGEHHLLAHPVQKAAADVGLQRLHGVADGALREKSSRAVCVKLPVRARITNAWSCRLSRGPFINELVSSKPVILCRALIRPTSALRHPAR